MNNFKPSQVMLYTPMPLVDTFKRAEHEIAAAIIVRTCQVNGDAWQSVTPSMIRKMLDDDTAAGTNPMASLQTNPFARPDMWGLINAGFAQDIGTPEERRIEFTPAGFARLEEKGWVRSSLGEPLIP